MQQESKYLVHAAPREPPPPASGTAPLLDEPEVVPEEPDDVFCPEEDEPEGLVVPDAEGEGEGFAGSLSVGAGSWPETA